MIPVPVDWYRSVLRPLLFALPAEKAHSLGQRALALEGLWRRGAVSRRTTDPRLRVDLGGIPLTSPVGLAPGFDKDADALRGLRHLGFGYLVVGSVLPAPRHGNPRPRLLRLPREESLVNSLGLPSRGVEYVVRRLRAAAAGPRSGGDGRVPVISSLVAFTLDDYPRCFELLQPLVDGIEIALFCPNTDEPTDFTRPGPFEQLLRALRPRQGKPLFVKLHPYETPAERAECLRLVELAQRYGVAGVTVAGSFTRVEPRLAVGRGSVSGRPAYPRMLRYVRDLYEVTRGGMAIKALGGIFSAADAMAAIAAGATTVELLTAFVYEGWNLAARLNRELAALLDSCGAASLQELRGSASAAEIAGQQATFGRR